MLHNAGRDYVSAAIGGTAVQPAAANFLGLTASTAAPVAGDTTLVGEIATGTLARTQAAYAHTNGTASIRNVTIAIIAAISIAGCSGDSNESTVADTVEPTISTSALPTGETPTTIEATPDTVGPGQGTGYFAGAEDVPITFTLPAGWTNNGWGVIKGDPIFGLIFMNVANIYSDSCPSVQVNPPVGPTVDDLASAWASMPGFNATAASDVTVDGFDGKYIELTVPDYNEKDCTYGMFNLLREAGSHGDYWAQGPNQHHQLWILDVDGTRLVIGATYFPNTSQQDRADLKEILNSIQIG